MGGKPSSEKILVPLPPDWVDDFTYTVVVGGFIFGFLHLLLLGLLRMDKQIITRVILIKAIFVFLVAVARLAMLIVVEDRDNEDPIFMYDYCWGWKLLEIGFIGISNCFDAITSIIYLRLVQRVNREKLTSYMESRTEQRILLGIFIFLISVVFFTTGWTMEYADIFLVNKTYCLAVGGDKHRDKQFSNWLAMCICVPAGVMFVAFVMVLYVMATSKVINEVITEDLFHSFHRIRMALFWGMISYFLTNILDIFWVIYYPESPKEDYENRSYLASAQAATLQNFTDFVVDFYFFLWPQLKFFLFHNLDDEWEDTVKYEEPGMEDSRDSTGGSRILVTKASLSINTGSGIDSSSLPIGASSPTETTTPRPSEVNVVRDGSSELTNSRDSQIIGSRMSGFMARPRISTRASHISAATSVASGHHEWTFFGAVKKAFETSQVSGSHSHDDNPLVHQSTTFLGIEIASVGRRSFSADLGGGYDDISKRKPTSRTDPRISVPSVGL